MPRQEFSLVFREDGSIDPDCLEQAGLDWIKHWLERRLAGNDPYLPLDKRYDEDPDAVVVALLRKAGLAHPAAMLISRAVYSLLASAERSAPNLPAYFRNLLRICQEVRLPQTSDWFTGQLSHIANDPVEAEAHWGGHDPTKEIVYAVMVQSPGLRTAASHVFWKALLAVPDFATLALGGLSRSFADELSYLAAWWRSCPVGQRSRELHQIVFTALKTEGKERVLSLLGECGKRLPKDLKNALNFALSENGIEAAFSRSAERYSANDSLWGAITGAGQKRELVLELA